MKQSLPQLIKILISDMRQAIIGIILGALILSVGGIYLFAKNVWHWLQTTMQLSVPLWVTILLVLLSWLYTYLKFGKSRSFNNKPSDVITLDEIELKILIYFATQEHDKISPEDISKSVDINLQLAIFHLNNLKNKQMVDSRPIAPFDHSPKQFWTLSQPGRRYLIENNHIS